MKTLTLTEPWASLVAIGAKQIETRSWKTPYRGQLAIHSAKGFPKYAREMLSEPLVYEAWGQFGLKQKFPNRCGCGFPHGCVIAITTLIDCIPIEAIADDPRWGNRINRRESFLGDYTPGRFAWILGTAMAIDPDPAKGALGLWDWDADMYWKRHEQ
jgi:hypothetical protein